MPAATGRYTLAESGDHLQHTTPHCEATGPGGPGSLVLSATTYMYKEALQALITFNNLYDLLYVKTQYSSIVEDEQEGEAAAGRRVCPPQDHLINSHSGLVPTDDKYENPPILKDQSARCFPHG